jgi:hypothetical protein
MTTYHLKTTAGVVALTGLLLLWSAPITLAGLLAVALLVWFAFHD